MLVTSTRAATLDAAPRRVAFDGLSPSAVSSVPLSLYCDPPNEELTLDDFEVLAFERMKVLKMTHAERSHGTKPRDMDDKIRKAVREHIGAKLEDPAVYRRDQVSHHILRFAYCDTEEKRRWFLTEEVALFKWRLEQLTPEQIMAFIRINDLRFQLATDAERSELMPQLKMVWDATAFVSADDVAVGGVALNATTVEYYKLPFTDALDLVRTRSVVLYGGYAFVPRTKLTSIICARFRAYLSKSLVKAATVLGSVLEDERLKPVLTNMARAYTGKEYGRGKTPMETVTADSVDAIAASAFPLCMQKLSEALKSKHKLKHWGRLQYGLFLKGIGMPVEESMEYFKREFTKGMTAEDFLKQYAYNVRHMYGLEGKRTNYTPYACGKIILGSPPGADDDHGCPYKHWDAGRVRSSLMSMQLPVAHIDAIMELVRTKDYQLACRRQFEARFGTSESGDVGEHPNAYTEHALAFLKSGAAPVSPSVLPGTTVAMRTPASGASAADAAATSSPAIALSPDADLSGLDPSAFDFDDSTFS